MATDLKEEILKSEVEQAELDGVSDPDAEFGGHEARKEMEKRLIRKLDARYALSAVSNLRILWLIIMLHEGCAS